VAHVLVNVTILDMNDNCPMFVNLPYYAVVSVDAIKGSLVYKVGCKLIWPFNGARVLHLCHERARAPRLIKLEVKRASSLGLKAFIHKLLMLTA